MTRQVSREWLDQLLPFDFRALQSRRDLRRINFWMGHCRHLGRALARTAPRRLAEIGAGDGSLMLALASRLHRCGVEVEELTLIDCQRAVSPGVIKHFQEFRWKVHIITDDVFAALERSQAFDAIIANLFLHHFSDHDLARLFGLIAQKSRFFAACEPRRSWRCRGALPLLRLLGCNEITRTDAALSIRAGFRGAELSALWPTGWDTLERPVGLFSHFFSACRAGP